MGYEIPASIGAFYSTKKPVYCIAGDGSIMMNIQELAIIGRLNLPIVIFILNNQGYSSIRQTQKNYFPDNIVGCSDDSGLPFPEFSKLASAFDIQYTSVHHSISDIDISLLRKLLNLILSKYFFPVITLFLQNSLVVFLKMVPLSLLASKTWLLSLTGKNLVL